MKARARCNQQPDVASSAPTAELSRRREARDFLAGKARLKSPMDGRPDTTDGKYTLPKDATQARRYLEHGAVVGRLQRFVGRTGGEPEPRPMDMPLVVARLSKRAAAEV